ncbi:hypothetical protein CANCADRAFT_30360 [Tortispora caseinolytica NRRL Y-17796]|uniref:Uncharacterized protein n=1 Tax=Tortispora caseinolytica NRRL Y-17796 TaxID=767744 RepID=A0A1E4TK29_9ASCO|nr:hypothetical protein CANCADRAFT_30360 [Tortispora caseinolytica NRRL Y-17796]
MAEHFTLIELFTQKYKEARKVSAIEDDLAKDLQVLTTQDVIQKRNNSLPYGLESVALEQLDEEAEKRFNACFPKYRKRIQWSLSGKGIAGIRSKFYTAMALSPSAKRALLVEDKKWSVYELDEESNEPPQLICTGKVTGEYSTGRDPITMRKAPLNWPQESDQTDVVPLATSPTSHSDTATKSNEAIASATEYSIAALADNIAVLASPNGVLTVHNIQREGRPVYRYVAPSAIRALAVSPNGSCVACGYTVYDSVSDIEEPIISLHRITPDVLNSRSYYNTFAEPTIAALPIADPINTLTFSNDGAFLACSTIMQSRFMVINVSNADEPRVIMTSVRKIDNSNESEGITSMRFFPGNRLLAITCRAYDAIPIIVDVMGSFVGSGATEDSGTIANSTLVTQFPEVGSSVYSAAVSPRGNAIAFATNSGQVYVVSYSRLGLVDNSYTVVQVGKTVNANKITEAPAMRWSPKGYTLLVLDRRGGLNLYNFAAGMPGSNGTEECRVIQRA